MGSNKDNLSPSLHSSTAAFPDCNQSAEAIDSSLGSILQYLRISEIHTPIIDQSYARKY